jgi:hypothetical protein
MTAEKPRMSDFDSPWKEALDAYFEAFLAFFFAPIHADIDWQRGHETLDKELQQIVPDAALGRRYVDKLVKVWRRDGIEEWVLIHIEVQYSAEADFARRMFIYHYRLLDRYDRRVASLAVLGDDRADWRPDRYTYDLWGCRNDFRFPIVKLLDFAAVEPTLENQANPFATVVLAHLKTRATHQDPATRQVWKLRLVKNLYERGLEREQVRQLFRFIDWMMDLPEPLEIVFRQEMTQYEQEKRMPYVTSIERLARAEGKLEGELEGKSEALLTGIEVGLELKFGATGLECLPEIRKIEDVQTLQTILQAIKTATSIEELRRLWS